jgi:hypothetical protein
VRTVFRAHVEQPHLSNGILLTDRLGTLVWGGGSVQRRQLLPAKPGRTYMSSVEVALKLAPGTYLLSSGISTPSIEHNARTGEVHDRFADVAELQVLDFDLGDGQPVPFWGLVDLPHSVRSCVELKP